MNSSRTLRAPRPDRSHGFTLVELLVAISVLAVLMSMVLQLMSSATRLTSTSRQATDCDTEARYALNQIASDLKRRVNREDVSGFVDKRPGNDRIYLFAEAPGYSPDLDPTLRSPLALLGYRIKEEPRRFVLQRYSRTLPWASTGGAGDKAMPFVQISPDTKEAIPLTTLAGVFPTVISEEPAQDNFYQTIAENVVRMEICLLKKPEVTVTETGTTTGTTTMLDDDKVEKELNEHGFTRISAIVVTIAIMDPQNMVRVNTDQLKSLFGSATFDAAPTDTGLKLPLETWNKELLTQSSKLPKPIMNGIRFYQRVINL